MTENLVHPLEKADHKIPKESDIDTSPTGIEKIDLSKLASGRAVEFVYRDQNLSIEREDVSVSGFDNQLVMEGKKFEVRDGKELVLGFYYHIDYGDYSEAGEFEPLATPVMGSSIEKLEKFKEDDKYSGLGILMARKFFGIIAMEGSSGKRFVHQVKHEEKMGLSPERWDELFVPMLIDKESGGFGYTKERQGVWHKEFNVEDRN